jgi:alkylated DNA repair dioxygenase AlkB
MDKFVSRTSSSAAATAAAPLAAPGVADGSAPVLTLLCTHLREPEAELVEYKLSDVLLRKIKQELSSGTIIRHNEPCLTPMNQIGVMRRGVGFLSDESMGYFFSGTCVFAQKLTSVWKEILDAINAEMGADFNAMLLNEYDPKKEPNNHIGAHCDDERTLDASAGVFAISIGESRTFRITRAGTAKVERVLDVQTYDGQCLQMRGAQFQKRFKHEVPRKAKAVGKRVSITFRKHDPSLETALYEKYKRGKVAEHRRERAAEATLEAEEETLAPGVAAHIDAAIAANRIPLARMRGEETEVSDPPSKKQKPDGTGGSSVDRFLLGAGDDEFDGRVYGSTGGAGHGHGGPGL